MHRDIKRLAEVVEQQVGSREGHPWGQLPTQLSTPEADAPMSEGTSLLQGCALSAIKGVWVTLRSLHIGHLSLYGMFLISTRGRGKEMTL